MYNKAEVGDIYLYEIGERCHILLLESDMVIAAGFGEDTIETPRWRVLVLETGELKYVMDPMISKKVA